MKIDEMLHAVQIGLKAPKERVNKFGGYKYRSCEDILDALKKVMPVGCSVQVSDAVELIGDRFYIKATATFRFAGETLTAIGYAREAAVKKGMDDAQITGTASSYARKYALNGLFAIDDSADDDSTNNGESACRKPEPLQQQQKEKMKIENAQAEMTPIGEKRAEELMKMIASAGKKQEEVFKWARTMHEFGEIKDMPIYIYHQLNSILSKAIKEANKDG